MYSVYVRCSTHLPALTLPHQPVFHNDVEGWRLHADVHGAGVERRKLGAGRGAHAESAQYAHKQQECLQAPHHLPNTPPLAVPEHGRLLGHLAVHVALWGQKPPRVEVLGVVPQLRVVGRAVKVSKHHGSFGDEVSVQPDVLGGGVRDGQRHHHHVSGHLQQRGLRHRHLEAVVLQREVSPAAPRPQHVVDLWTSCWARGKWAM